MSRIFLSDEGYWCDHAKPVAEDGGIVHEPSFEECNPEEVVDELEAKLAKALEYARHHHGCVAIYGRNCECGWVAAKKEIAS